MAGPAMTPVVVRATSRISGPPPDSAASPAGTGLGVAAGVGVGDVALGVGRAAGLPQSEYLPLERRAEAPRAPATLWRFTRMTGGGRIHTQWVERRRWSESVFGAARVPSSCWPA